MNPGAAAVLSRQQLIRGIKLLQTFAVAALYRHNRGARMALKVNVSKWWQHFHDESPVAAL